MIHVSIHYTPSAVLRFTKREADIMLECAKKHYDAVCKEAANTGSERYVNGRPGVIQGIRNCIENAGEGYDHRLSFRDIDTMAKCLEVCRFLPDEDKQREGFCLGLSLSKVLESLNANGLHPLPIDIDYTVKPARKPCSKK